MFKKITFIFLTLFTFTTVFSQVIQKKTYDISTLNDGPFVFIEQDKLVHKEIINGELTIKNLSLNAFKTTFNAEE